jgi:hypothetical protein
VASLSLQIAPGFAGNLDVGFSVTAGTAAPTTANNVEVRIDLASNWDVHEVRQAFDTFLMYLLDTNYNQSLPQANAGAD